MAGNIFPNFIFQEINRILSYTVTGKIFPDEAEFQETVELKEGTETSFERYFEIYQRWQDHQYFQIHVNATTVSVSTFPSPSTQSSAGSERLRSSHWDYSPSLGICRATFFESILYLSIENQTGPPRCRGLLRGIASPAILCHKEPARASKFQSPPRWFFMA